MKKFFPLIATFVMVVAMNAQNVISVDSALAIGNALDSAATTTQEYTIQGYVVNAAAFNQQKHNQNWYMADDPASTAKDFQAFACVAIENGDTVEAQNGDKVELKGKIQRYYDSRGKKFTIQVKNGVASFLARQTCNLDTISVSAALDLLAAADPCPHVVEGVVSQIDSAYLNNGNINITLEDIEAPAKTIYCYKTYAGKGVNFTSPLPIKVNDTIQVYGKTLKMYNTTPELADEVYLSAIVGIGPVDSTVVPVDTVPLVPTGKIREVTLDYSEKGYANQESLDGVDVVENGVTFTLAKGSGSTKPAYYNTGTGARTYGGNTLTISAGDDIITKIVFNFTQNNKNYTVNVGSYSKDTKTWTGLARTVVFSTETGSGHNRIKSITATVDGEGGEVVTYDTISVEEAIAIADTLVANKNSKKYYIEGYAAYVEEYSFQYKNQGFYLVADTTAPDSVLKVFRATPTKDNVAYPVLAGDKVRLFGPLQKYVQDSTAAPQFEVYCPTVEFLEEVAGDRTIVEPASDTITIVRALQIGDSIGQGKSTSAMYVLEGYVTALTDSRGNPTADGGYAQYGNQTMWLADTMDSTLISKDKAFMVYQAVASDSTQITKGAKLSLKCAIKNYNGTIENAAYPIVVTVLEKGEDPVKPVGPDTISVDSALVIGNTLTAGKSTEKTYSIMGYVSKIDDNSYSTQYKNMTFWITSEPSTAATNAEGAFQVYRGKPDRELVLGNKVLVTTQIQKYTNGVIESMQNCPVLFLEQGGLPTYDTLTVDMAKYIADTLPVNVPSKKKYYVIGYAANVSEYDSRYPHQDFYMVTDTTAPNTDLQAFHAIPTKDNVAAPVLAGDKVCLFGSLQKYVENATSAPQLQVVKPVAEILEAVDGDRTIPDPKWDKITVAQALEIGASLASNGVTELKYEITGYVSFIANLYNTSTKKENFWIADTRESQASSNADGAFYVYGGQPKTEQEVGLGAKVSFVTTIKKYVPSSGSGSPVIENEKAVPVEVLEQGELIVDTLSVAAAKEEALKLNRNQTGAKFYAVKGFIHKVKDAYSTQYKNASFYISDDLNDTEDDVYCYRASLSEADASKVAVGSYVIVTGHLMHNYYNNVSSAQIPTGSAIFTDAPAPVELEPITVAEALEVAKALTPDMGDIVKTTDKYAVKGYVVRVKSAEKKTYVVADEVGDKGEFQFFRCDSIDREVNVGDLVIATGRIEHFYDQVDDIDFHLYMISGGTLEHAEAQGIENVTLTTDVDVRKIMLNGVLYIIRNGKMYDIRGALVR